MQISFINKPIVLSLWQGINRSSFLKDDSFLNDNKLIVTKLLIESNHFINLYYQN